MITHKTAEDILVEYVEVDDINSSQTIEILPLTIIDMMIEFAEYHLEMAKQSNNYSIKNIK